MLCGCSSDGKKPIFKSLTNKDLSVLTSPPAFYSEPPKKIIPPAPKKITGKPISVSLTPSSPLLQSLQHMANLGGINLSVDSKALQKKEGVFYRCHQKDVYVAIDEVCRLLELRCCVDDAKIIYISADEPYLQNYEVQFLNMIRSGDGLTGVDHGGFNTKTDDKLMPANGNESTSKIKSNTTVDFWKEIRENVGAIMKANPSYYCAISKSAGILTCFAKQKEHQQIKNYIDMMRFALSSQVLIEAKIVEVWLQKEYRTGIDWSVAKEQSHIKLNMMFGASSGAKNLVQHVGNSQGFTFGLHNMGNRAFQAVISALEAFGSVRTLSNPRLTIMNNQIGLLKVTQHDVFFQLKSDTFLSNQGSQNVAVGSVPQIIPTGLVMTVQPCINMKSGEIILYVRPTITKVTRHVTDPAPEIALQSVQKTNPAGNPNPLKDSKEIQSQMPVVEMREIETVLRLNDGEMAVVGGLMELASEKMQEGLPGTLDKPLLQDIASSQAMGDQVKELVIILRAQIIHSDQNATPSPCDDRLLKQYVRDPRS